MKDEGMSPTAFASAQHGSPETQLFPHHVCGLHVHRMSYYLGLYKLSFLFQCLLLVLFQCPQLDKGESPTRLTHALSHPRSTRHSIQSTDSPYRLQASLCLGALPNILVECRPGRKQDIVCCDYVSPSGLFKTRLLRRWRLSSVSGRIVLLVGSTM
jgi:hypothetical protein